MLWLTIRLIPVTQEESDKRVMEKKKHYYQTCQLITPIRLTTQHFTVLLFSGTPASFDEF